MAQPAEKRNRFAGNFTKLKFKIKQNWALNWAKRFKSLKSRNYEKGNLEVHFAAYHSHFDGYPDHLRGHQLHGVSALLSGSQQVYEAKGLKVEGSKGNKPSKLLKPPKPPTESDLTLGQRPN